MRSWLLGCLAAVSAFACSGAKPPTPSTPPRAAALEPRPVVVALVVDQLSAWVAEERVPELPKDGFFAQMVREGTWAKRMRYPYAITDTAPGHAALHSGKTPNESRILVNENPDDKTGVRTSYFRDPATRLVDASGVRSDLVGSSARSLAVPTVADRLREASPKAKIVSVSLKDRAALLPAGQRPDHAIWFDPAVDSFVTSTAIESTMPAWAASLGGHEAVKKARASGWTLLDRDWVASHAGKDDAPGEGDLLGMGITFPHPVTNARSFRATPLPDPMILDMALAAVRAERVESQPFLLLVSLSSSDIIGHTFGASSWESWDHLRRLDRELARFLRELLAIAPGARVILSGDHGNSAIPEARGGCKAGERVIAGDPYERPCGGGGRIIPDVLRDEVREEVAKAIGRADAVAGVSDGYVFLSAEGRALDASKRAKIAAVITRVLAEKHAGTVEAVFDVNELAAKCPAELAKSIGSPKRALANAETLFTLVCRSWAPDAGAGDFYIVPAHGSYFDGEIVPGKGGSHGSPWIYDRTVPLFVRGPGIAAGVTFTDPVDFTAYSALEATFLDLDPFLGFARRSPGDVLDAARAR